MIFNRRLHGKTGACTLQILLQIINVRNLHLHKRVACLIRTFSAISGQDSKQETKVSEMLDHTEEAQFLAATQKCNTNCCLAGTVAMVAGHKLFLLSCARELKIQFSRRIAYDSI